MIARELTEFFAGFAPDGVPDVLARRRAGLPLQRQRLLPARVLGGRCASPTSRYAEDQAFARAMGAHGWRRAYRPDAAVLHAHDYSPLGLHAPLLRRVPRAARDDRPRRADRRALDGARRARARRRRPALDARAGLAARAARAAATGRSLVHHTSRKLASALGSRAHRLPAAGRSARSRSSGAATASTAAARSRRSPRPPRGPHHLRRRSATVAREGPAPLLAAGARDGGRASGCTSRS